MQKRILFIAPDYYDFYKVVLTGFEKYSGCETTMVVINEHHRTYVYKNRFEKIYNFFLKTFLNKNLKKIRIKESLKNQICAFPQYDYLFIMRPDILDEDVIKLAIRKSKKSITFYWDSFDKIKTQKKTMKFFDKCYSFDKEDCANFGLELLNNFYYNDEIDAIPTYDVHYIGTFDKRFETLIKIFDKLKSRNKKLLANIYSPNFDIIAQSESETIKMMNTTFPFPLLQNILKDTKVMLDIHHENQVGLSFRIFDSIGMKKKLITTNPTVKEYDFYNPNNIFVLTDVNEDIPEKFFDSPYMEIPEEIKNKYSLKSWTEKLLS